MRVLLTGGAGFIGSVVLGYLNAMGIKSVYVVDSLGTSDKWKNLVGKRYEDLIPVSDCAERLQRGLPLPEVDAVIHLGASTSTTERDADAVVENNFRYSCRLRAFAAARNLRFVYASSAATYGMGEHGFVDDASQLLALRPLNIYGYSKQMFDLWMTGQDRFTNAVGLKFFNVFGPNEYHKEDMASVVFKSFTRLENGEKLTLFRSHHPHYADGEQLRDFVYVKDVAGIVLWCLENKDVSGVLNVGTGAARSWKDLALGVFAARGEPPAIEFVDMPENLRDRYQYRTEADMSRLRSLGYEKPFTSLEDAIRDYVQGYLSNDWPYF